MEEKKPNYVTIYNRQRLYLELLDRNTESGLLNNFKKLTHSEIIAILDKKYPIKENIK